VRMELIMGFSLLLASVSLAENESLIAGPYKISFDLNATHSANNTTETHSETFSGSRYDAYTIMLNNSNNFAFITALHFAENLSNNMSKDDKGVYFVEDFLLGFDCYNITMHERTIDNRSGVISVGVDSNGNPMYAAQYRPMLDASCIKGETEVLIVSNYLWDDGTLSLLKTIHVELDM
jgi:hypothetical protein